VQSPKHFLCLDELGRHVIVFCVVEVLVVGIFIHDEQIAFGIIPVVAISRVKINNLVFPG